MTRPLRLATAAALATAGLVFASCGGDDETTTASVPTASTTSGSTGATGAADAGGASYDITAGEYVDAAIPDEITAMKDFVADNPDECAGENATNGGNFPQNVGIQAASVDPDTPLSEVILAVCAHDNG